jgi:hypothetical protein
MSTNNILSRVPFEVEGEAGVVVTFSINRGTDTRSYLYTGAEALAIIAGADPSQFSGERMS